MVHSTKKRKIDSRGAYWHLSMDSYNADPSIGARQFKAALIHNILQDGSVVLSDSGVVNHYYFRLNVRNDETIRSL